MQANRKCWALLCVALLLFVALHAGGVDQTCADALAPLFLLLFVVAFRPYCGIERSAVSQLLPLCSFAGSRAPPAR
jgi:hypothetical protein